MLIYVAVLLYHYFDIIIFHRLFYQIIFDIHPVHLEYRQMVLRVKANILHDRLKMLDLLLVESRVYQRT